MSELYLIWFSVAVIQVVIFEALRRTKWEDTSSLTGILNKLEREMKEKKQGGAK